MAPNGRTLPTPRGAPPVAVGDHSAIPGVLLAMYLALAAYAGLAVWLTGCPWYTIPVYYVLALWTFYLWHVQAHHHVAWLPFNRECTRLHRLHHFKIYPPAKFFGDGDGAWNPGEHTHWFSAHEALLQIGGLAILAGAHVVFGERWEVLLAVLVMYVVVGVVGTWLHRTFHIKGHWLEAFAWFHELRALHFLHHLGSCKHNYAVLNFGVLSPDRWFGSFLLDDPRGSGDKAGVEDSVATASEADLQEALRHAVAEGRIDATALKRALACGRLASTALMQEVDSAVLAQHETATLTQRQGSMALARGVAALISRGLLIGLGVLLWHQSQAYLSRLTVAATPSPLDRNHTMRDRGFDALAAVWPSELSVQAKASSLLVLLEATEVLTLFLLMKAWLGASVRPLLALLLALALRLLLNITTALPEPAASVWWDPDVRAQLAQSRLFQPLLTTLEARSDTLACVPVLVAVVAAREALLSVPDVLGWRLLTLGVGTLLVLCSAGLTLVLHLNWSFSVVLGMTLGFAAMSWAKRYADVWEVMLP